jgi:hypothetical protein
VKESPEPKCACRFPVQPRAGEAISSHALTRPPTSEPPARIARERKTIVAMVALYCRAHHAPAEGLCEECRELLDYASRRLDTCPFHAGKPACNKCAVHCYTRAMRARVVAVMRYAGPRMLWRHPWLAVRHLLDALRPAPPLPSKAHAPRASAKVPRSRQPP